MNIFSVLTAFLLFTVAEGKNMFRIVTSGLTDCDYRGYAPGGKVKEISDIVAPVAEITHGGLKSILDEAYKYECIGSSGAAVVDAFTKKFAKIAPKLASTLGLFGVATSILGSLGEPGLDDVMTAVNGAISDLTDSVNQKLDQMEGYCDTRVISLEKDLINADYTSAYNYWSRCLTNEFNEEDSTDCQMDIAKRLYSDYVKYAKLYNEVENWKTNTLSGYDRRRLEASLITYRDYANLMIMVHNPLIEKFCEVNSDEGKFHCQKYTEIITTEVKKYIEYVQNATSIIEAATGNMGVCPDTITCSGQTPVYEGGLFKVHTCNRFNCKCVIDDSNTKQYCKVDGTIRVDGNRNIGADWRPYYYPCGASDWPCASEQFGGRIVKGEAQKYETKNAPVVKAYWEKNVLLMIPDWKKALDNVRPNLNAAGVKGKKLMKNGDMYAWYHYSKGHQERVKKAGMKPE